MTSSTHRRSDLLDRVKVAAHGRWLTILADLAGIDPGILDGQHHPCPKCRGVDRFRLIDADAGACLCNQCFSQKNGDGISAVQWMLGCDFPEALRRIADFLSLRPADPVVAAKRVSGTKASETLTDAFEVVSAELQDALFRLFVAAKPPITAEAIKAADGIAVRWPMKLNGDTRCIAFPAIDDHRNVRGWILRRVDGGNFAAIGKLKARKTHMVKGSHDGWIVPGGWERVENATIVWKTEGLPDALALFSLLPADHAVVTNIAGAKSVPPSLSPLNGKTVYLVPDADRPGMEGAEKYARKLAGTAAQVRIVPLPFEMTEDHGRDLRDWLTEGGDFNKLVAFAEAAEVYQSAKSGGKPDIEITTNEFDVIDQAVEALATDPDVYVRSGTLVTILKDAPNEPPRISPLHVPTIREKITRFAALWKDDEFVNPPDWLPKGVFFRGQWPGIRNLAGVVTTPILRPDGSILNWPGYDAATGLFLDLCGLQVEVTQSPTADDAIEAASRLCDVFTDFPLADEDYNESAVLAAVLTGFARYAFPGPSPLFLIDSNVRGSGKSLLADAIGLIHTGDNLPRMSNPKNDDEARKQITSLAVRGDRMCLIDNVNGELGGAALDAALTATRWQDRLLKTNDMVDLPLQITWFATGNNVILAADTSRRVCPIRLNCSHEKPEERTDFQFPDLRKHIRSNREQLIGNALTILRAFCVAGRPQQSLPGWGSFEGWSDLIRQCVVWLGWRDPASGRAEVMEQSDIQAGALRQLLENWKEVDPWNEGITTGDLMTKLSQERNSYPAVREAILELCGGTFDKPPSVRIVGTKFRGVRRRVVGGKMLDASHNRNKVNIWKVVSSDSA